MKIDIKNEKIRGLLITIGVFFGGMIIIALILDTFVMPIVVREGSETQVPSVTNLSLPAAEARLKEANLEMTLGSEEFDSSMPKGAIINQIPEAGAVVKKGRKVIVIISKGSASATVPQLNGYTLREGRFMLQKEGLQQGSVSWVEDTTRPDGVIITSLPPSGTVMRLNAAVQLVVNRLASTMTIKVPDFVGLDLDEAKNLAEENYLLIGEISYQINERLLPETVMAQSIPEGAMADKWTVINLTVSSLE
jgi:beta-lactam-binding protein with PASTA domain